MNVNIICVGKIKEKYINDGIAEFSKRMQAFGKLSVTELKEFGNDFEREISIKKEAENILAATYAVCAKAVCRYDGKDTGIGIRFHGIMHVVTIFPGFGFYYV